MRVYIIGNDGIMLCREAPPPAPSSLDGADNEICVVQTKAATPFCASHAWQQQFCHHRQFLGQTSRLLTEILMQMMPKIPRQIAGRRAGKGQMRCTGFF
jgi:hypothetical protein